MGFLDLFRCGGDRVPDFKKVLEQSQSADRDAPALEAKEKLSKNFHISEFNLPEGFSGELYHNVLKLAKELQKIRNKVAKPVKIVECYRDGVYNNLRGLKNSKHIEAKAADIKVSRMSSKKLKEVIDELVAKKRIKPANIKVFKKYVHYEII